MVEQHLRPIKEMIPYGFYCKGCPFFEIIGGHGHPEDGKLPDGPEYHCEHLGKTFQIKKQKACNINYLKPKGE